MSAWRPVVIVVFSILTAVLALRAQTAQVSDPDLDKLIQETLLCEKDGSMPPDDSEDRFSPDLAKVAWRSRRGDKMVAMVNDTQQGPAFEEVQALRFGTDPFHFTFRGKRNGRWVQVLDGTMFPTEYDEINEAGFSPKGKYLMYGAKRESKWHAVLNGKEEPAFDSISRYAFDSDDRHFAYSAQLGREWHMVRDGQIDPAAYDEIRFVRLSNDGKRMAYVARKNDKMTVIVDGKEGPQFHGIAGLQFSSDGSHVLYSGSTVSRMNRKASGTVVLDGRKERTYPAILAFPYQNPLQGVFGYRSLFVATLHGVSTPIMTQDGKHVAYGAALMPHFITVLFDGMPGPSLEYVDEPALSGDGKHVAYFGRTGTGSAFFLDGKPMATLAGEEIYGESVVFSPDHTRAAGFGFLSHPGIAPGDQVRRRVFAFGKVSREFECRRITNLTFSTDSKHVLFEVHASDGGRSFVVMDQWEGKRYDRIVSGSARFNADGSFTYVARSGQKYFRVTQKIPESWR